MKKKTKKKAHEHAKKKRVTKALPSLEERRVAALEQLAVLFHRYVLVCETDANLDAVRDWARSLPARKIADFAK